MEKRQFDACVIKGVGEKTPVFFRGLLLRDDFRSRVFLLQVQAQLAPFALQLGVRALEVLCDPTGVEAKGDWIEARREASLRVELRYCPSSVGDIYSVYEGDLVAYMCVSPYQSVDLKGPIIYTLLDGVGGSFYRFKPAPFPASWPKGFPVPEARS